MDFLYFGLPSITVLVTFGCYTVVSCVFYYYPEIIYRKKTSRNNKNYNFVVVSHRGGSGEQKENTLPAFKHSHEIGTDVIELDCHITRDGKVVVIHDNNLSRLCGVDKLVSDFNYDELPLLLEEHEEDIFLRKNSDFRRVVSSSLITNSIHRRNSNDNSVNSRKIPLLEDVFESLPNMPVNDLIVKYNREKITVWGSFKEEVTKKLYKLNPNVDIYFSSKGCIKILLLMLTGLLPFVPFKESYLEIIMPNQILKTSKNSLPGPFIAALLLVKTFFVRKSLVRHLQKRGISVYYWVLNTDEEFRHAIEIGVDGIITDYPSRLIEFIETNQDLKKSLVRPEKIV